MLIIVVSTILSTLGNESFMYIEYKLNCRIYIDSYMLF